MYKPPYKESVQNDPGPGQSVVSLIHSQKPPAPSCSKPFSQNQDKNLVNGKKVNKNKQLGNKIPSKSLNDGAMNAGVTKAEVIKEGVKKLTVMMKTGVVKATKPEKKIVIPPKPIRPISAFLYFLHKNVPMHAEQGNKDGITKGSQMWRALSQSERDKHELEYQKANIKYKADLVEYNKIVEQVEEMKAKNEAEKMKKKKQALEMKKKKKEEELKKRKETPLYNIPTNKYIKTKKSCEAETNVQSNNIEQSDIQKDSDVVLEEGNGSNAKIDHLVENIVGRMEYVDGIEMGDKTIEDRVETEAGAEGSDTVDKTIEDRVETEGSDKGNKTIEDRGETEASTNGSDGKDRKKHISCTCGKAFSSIFWYQTHTKKCKAGFDCDKCPKKFKNLKCLKKHNKLVHIQGNVCTVCDASFSTDRLRNFHMKTTHADTVTCPSCKKMYKNERSMKKHLRQFCEKNVANNKVQKKKETVKTIIKCAICPKTYDSKRGLRYHKAKFHRKNNVDGINSINTSVKDTENESISSDDYDFEDDVEMT